MPNGFSHYIYKSMLHFIKKYVLLILLHPKLSIIIPTSLILSIAYPCISLFFNSSINNVNSLWVNKPILNYHPFLDTSVPEFHIKTCWIYPEDNTYISEGYLPGLWAIQDEFIAGLEQLNVLTYIHTPLDVKKTYYTFNIQPHLFSSDIVRLNSKKALEDRISDNPSSIVYTLIFNKNDGNVSTFVEDYLNSILSYPTNDSFAELDYYPDEDRIRKTIVYNPTSLSFTQFFLLSFSYLLILGYSILSLSKVTSVKSKLGLLIAYFVQVSISFIASFCLFKSNLEYLEGVPNKVLPFVVIVVGIENSFRLIKGLEYTAPEKPALVRVTYAFMKVGYKSIYLVLLDIIVLECFKLVFNSSIDLFCDFIIFTLIIDLFLHCTYFLGVLYIDIRRLELQDLLNQNFLSDLYAAPPNQYWNPDILAPEPEKIEIEEDDSFYSSSKRKLYQFSEIVLNNKQSLNVISSFKFGYHYVKSKIKDLLLDNQSLPFSTNFAGLIVLIVILISISFHFERDDLHKDEIISNSFFMRESQNMDLLRNERSKFGLPTRLNLISFFYSVLRTWGFAVPEVSKSVKEDIMQNYDGLINLFGSKQRKEIRKLYGVFDKSIFFYELTSSIKLKTPKTEQKLINQPFYMLEFLYGVKNFFKNWVLFLEYIAIMAFIICLTTLIVTYLMANFKDDSQYDEDDALYFVQENDLDLDDPDNDIFSYKELIGFHSMDIVDIYTSPSGKIVTIGLDRRINLWSLTNSMVLPPPKRIFAMPSVWPITSVLIDRFNQYIIFSAGDGSLYSSTLERGEGLWKHHYSGLVKTKPLLMFFVYMLDEKKNRIITKLVILLKNGNLMWLNPRTGDELVIFPILRPGDSHLSCACGLLTPRLPEKIVSLTDKKRLLVSHRVYDTWHTETIDLIQIRMSIGLPISKYKEYTLRGSKTETKDDNATLIPFPQLGMVLYAYSTYAELIDISSGIIMKSFKLRKFSPGSLRAFHSVLSRCSFCGSLSVATFSIAYMEEDLKNPENEKIAVMHSYTTQNHMRGTICLRIERDPREKRCLGFEFISESIEWLSRVQCFELTDMNMIMGLREVSSERSEEHEEFIEDLEFISAGEYDKLGDDYLKNNDIEEIEESDNFGISFETIFNYINSNIHKANSRSKIFHEPDDERLKPISSDNESAASTGINMDNSLEDNENNLITLSLKRFRQRLKKREIQRKGLSEKPNNVQRFFDMKNPCKDFLKDQESNENINDRLEGWTMGGDGRVMYYKISDIFSSTSDPFYGNATGKKLSSTSKGQLVGFFGPSCKYGHKSIAVVYGNSVRIFYFGNAEFVLTR